MEMDEESKRLWDEFRAIAPPRKGANLSSKPLNPDIAKSIFGGASKIKIYAGTPPELLDINDEPIHHANVTWDMSDAPSFSSGVLYADGVAGRQIIAYTPDGFIMTPLKVSQIFYRFMETGRALTEDEARKICEEYEK
jgi:hypothetical protein